MAAGKLEAAGIPYVRRSRLGGRERRRCRRVLLLDSIGELSGLFAVADVVFMGGTLAQRGGHNILEPALFGKPVIAGPHMENFQAIADDFRAAARVRRDRRAGGAGRRRGAVAGRAGRAADIGQRARWPVPRPAAAPRPARWRKCAN